jgi:hypothetical protein
MSLMARGAAGQAATQPTEPGRPRVYALVAAVGEKFSVVESGPVTGTHLSPYRRSTTDVPDNILNRFVLHSLDVAVAKVDPQSQRIYLFLPAAQLDGVAPSQRESMAVDRIIEALRGMPQRSEWERIVVAIPAYQALERNGIASKLHGFGIFSERRCQAGCASLSRTDIRPLDPEPLDGVDAITSEDKAIKARTYLAPFSYIAVWILDPESLTVLDRQQGFDNQKLAEPVYKQSLDIDQSSTRAYVSTRIASLIELSVGEAVMRSAVKEKLGTVRVGDVKDVTPPRDTGK